MPLPNEKVYTAEDYWNLPDGRRAELINGTFYNMAPPSRIHQKLSVQLCRIIGNYIESHDGFCEVYSAPFAVNLNSDDKIYVEPDISVICDSEKLTEHGCNGAPDFIIEIVSPSSLKMDYGEKIVLYQNAGVREYWIVDPAKQQTTMYYYEADITPVIFAFNQPIVVGIYKDLSITIEDLL